MHSSKLGKSRHLLKCQSTWSCEMSDPSSVLLVLSVHHPSFSCNVAGPYIVDLHVPVEAGTSD